MPGYDWTCSACGSGNEAMSETCTSCNLPANLSRLEIEVRRSGASSYKEYLYSKFRGIGRDPYSRDIAKSVALFLISLCCLAILVVTDLSVLWVLLIPVFAYSFTFFLRVWWRVLRSSVSDKPYERV